MQPQFDNVSAALAATASEEAEDRMTLDNVVDFVRAKFDSVESVTVEGEALRFSRQAINARRLLEGRLKLIRDRMKPEKDREKETKYLLATLDDNLVEAWDAGARTTDGAIEVAETAARKSWSDERVKNACKTMGVDYEEFCRAVTPPWLPGRKVKQYK